MSANKTKSVKHSLSFTVNDESIIDWIDNQKNTSLSLRLLIQNAINQSGYQDYPTFLGSLVNNADNSASVKQSTKNINETENPQKEKHNESIGSKSLNNDSGIDFMGTISNDQN